MYACVCVFMMLRVHTITHIKPGRKTVSRANLWRLNDLKRLFNTIHSPPLKGMLLTQRSQHRRNKGKIQR